MPEGKAKTGLVKFRVRPDVDELLRDGAAEAGVSLSDFVRDAAVARARNLLGERDID